MTDLNRVAIVAMRTGIPTDLVLQVVEALDELAAETAARVAETEAIGHSTGWMPAGPPKPAGRVRSRRRSWP